MVGKEWELHIVGGLRMRGRGRRIKHAAHGLMQLRMSCEEKVRGGLVARHQNFRSRVSAMGALALPRRGSDWACSYPVAGPVPGSET